VTSLQFEMAMHLLVYGDDKGQAWVLEGPAPIVEPAVEAQELEVEPQAPEVEPEAPHESAS